MNKSSEDTLSSLPLCVDLDNTLIRTDCLLESIFLYLKISPWGIFQLLFWFARGRAYLKEKLVHAVHLDVSSLPVRKGVLDFLKTAAHEGRPLYLVSASHQLILNQCCKRFEFFKNGWGSSLQENLKGERKARWLVEKFGHKGFDYIGDSSSDIPVWRKCRLAMVTGNRADALNRKLGKENIVCEVIEGETGNFLRSAWRAMRPHQWAKNLLLFVPLFAAHEYTDLHRWANLIIGFVSICLCASSGYLGNDLLDLSSDRRHHLKKHRPIASGALSIASAVFLASLLGVAGLLFAFRVGLDFLGAMLLYLLFTFFYSVFLKKILILDAITLSGFYVVRLWMGSLAAQALISEWLLGFSLFVFLSLAMAKRFAELYNLRKNGAPSNGSILDYREQAAGRSYLTSDLEQIAIFGTTSGLISVLVLALYISSEKSALFYNRPGLLWFACPALLYWIGRLWLLTHRGQMDEDPVHFALNDRVSWGVAFIMVFLFLIAGLKLF